MNINAKWHKELKLRDGTKETLIYTCDLNSIPQKPGVYIFFSRFGKSREIMYIGKAENLRTRIPQQLESVSLMLKIKKWGIGTKYLLFCIPEIKRGQKLKKVLTILEKGLIKHALSEGHELINIHGTRKNYHKLSFRGTRISEEFFGRKIISE